MRAFGGFLVLCGAAGYGSSLCRCLRGHLKQLLECRDILVELDSGRACYQLPYAQLLRRTALKKNGFYGEILLQIAEEMEKNREADVGVLWREALDGKKKELLLQPEEQDLVVILGKNLAFDGKSDKICEIYFMQLEDKIVQAMEEKKQKQKLYTAVSLLCGLFVVILLL